MSASFGLRDIFERPFDGEDDPRIRVAQAITRAEAEAILEHRSDLILALSAPSPVEGGGELEYAQRLATVAASKFGPPPGWKPLGDMFGVLSQIDNCLTGLEAPTSPPQATNSEVERLTRAAKALLNNIDEFGTITDGEFLEDLRVALAQQGEKT